VLDRVQHATRGLRQRVLRWLLADLHLGPVKFGTHSVTIDNLITMDTQATTVAGQIGMDAVTGRPRAFVDGGQVDLAHQVELGDGGTIVSTGAASFAVAAGVGLFLLDATANSVSALLPGLAGVSRRRVMFRREDATANTVTITPNGADTINGLASYALDEGDVIELTADASGTNWVVTTFISQADLVTADAIETEVLDRTAADFSNVVDYAAAEVLVGSQSASLDCRGRAQLSIVVEVTVVGSMSNIYVATRASAKAVPTTGTAVDWGRMNRTASVDVATGIDTSQPLEEKVPITGVGRYIIDLPVNNRHVSAIVWTDGAGGRGRVFMHRGR